MLYLQGFSRFGVLATTPFLRHLRIDLYEVISTYAAELKLLDCLIQRFIGHMNIPIHCGFDAGVSQQLLQHFRLHSAFNRTGCVGMSQRVHTKAVNPSFIAKLIEVGIIGTVFRRFPCAPVDKDQITHHEPGNNAGAPVHIFQRLRQQWGFFSVAPAVPFLFQNIIRFIR